MPSRTNKTAAPKPGAAVAVPAAPVVAEASSAPEVVVEVVPASKSSHRDALERIVASRLCGCKGDHDPSQYECPKTIARRALEES